MYGSPFSVSGPLECYVFSLCSKSSPGSLSPQFQSCQPHFYKYRILICVHCGVDYRILLAGLFQPFPGDFQSVFQSSVRQSDGSRSGYCSRHISHTVMNDAVHCVDRIIVISNLCGFAAAALIHCHVYNHASLLHIFQISFLHQLRRCFSGNQYASDHQIRVCHSFFQ